MVYYPGVCVTYHPGAFWWSLLLVWQRMPTFKEGLEMRALA